MSILARVLLALLSGAVLSTMAHQAILAMKYPESLIDLERRYRDSTGIKVYVGLLALGWGFAGYHAGAAFLGWVPDSFWYDSEGEYFNVGAGLIGLVTIIVPVAFWSLAEERTLALRLRREHSLLEKLARLPVLTQADADDAQRRLTENADPAIARLSGLIVSVLEDRRLALRHQEAQVARDAEHIRRETEEEQRRAAERRELDERARAQAEADAQLVAQSRDALRDYRKRVFAPYVTTFDDIGDPPSEFRIAESVFKDQWSLLKDAAKATIRVSEEDISRGHGPPYDVSALLEAAKATRLSPSIRLTASYSGDGHGGSTTVYGLGSYGERRPWSEVLTFEMTLNGLVEAFYFAHALPRLGVYWHGLYDRDHSFVTSDKGLVSFFADALATADGKSWVEAFSTPAGLRVRRIGTDFAVACLAVSPSGGLTDRTAALQAGRVVRVDSAGLRRSSMQILY